VALVKLVTFYEVYDKRALHQALATLPLLDRDRDVKKAKTSARAWGGIVVRVKAEILQAYPLVRRIVTHQVIFVHTPRPDKLDARDHITLRQLKGKLRQRSGRNHFRR
jgi:hypothetical protein